MLDELIDSSAETPFMQKFSHEWGIQNESDYPLLVLTNTDVRIDK